MSLGEGGGCDVLKPVFKGSAEPRLGFEPAPLFNRLRTPSELFTARSNQLAQRITWLHTRPLLPPSSTVPAGSPSRGGDATVHVPDTTSPASLLHSPCGLTFTWWGCHGSCSNINQPSLPTPFYSFLVSIFVFMALSTVFHSIHSPDLSPLSHSVLLVLVCLICSLNYMSLCESLSQP